MKPKLSVSNVKNYDSKSWIYSCFSIWNYGNDGKLFTFTHKCQKTQIKNSFGSILGLDFD
jgi:hypothetical protein